jgi:hypothetical protein
MAKQFGINIRLTGNIKDFEKKMKTAERRMKKVGKNLQAAGKQMSIAFTAPLAGIAALSVKTFAEFEQSMAKVAAVSGATGDEFKRLETLAKDLGASTRFTAQQVAELELNYSKLGFVPSEIEKITGATLDLALATGEDLAESATVAGATLRGFGLTAAEMPRVVDVMAASFSSSALDLEKFSVAMPKVGAAAKSAGFTLEQTTGLLGALVDRGVEASTAGTSLRKIFIELSKSGKSLDQALGEINNSQDKLGTAVELFGDRAAVAAVQLAENKGAISALTGELDNAEGKAKDMAATMDDTLQGAMFRMKSALEGAAITIGEALAPLVTKLSNFIGKLANSFKGLSPSVKRTILIIAGLVAAIGPLLVVLGFMMTSVIPGLVTAFSALLGPVGLVIAGVAALTVAYLKFGRVQREISPINSGFLSNLQAQRSELSLLFDAAKSAKRGSDIHKQAISEINKKYAEYLPNLLTEKSTLEEIKKAQDAATNALVRKIAVQSKEKDITEATTRATQQLKEANDEVIGVIKERKGASLIAVASQEIKSLIDLKNELGGGRDATMEWGDEVNKFAAKYGLSSADVQRSINKMISAQEDQAESIEEINTFYSTFIGDLQQATEESGNLANETNKVSDNFSGVKKQGTETLDSIEKLTDFFGNLGHAINFARGEMDQIEAPKAFGVAPDEEAPEFPEITAPRPAIAPIPGGDEESFQAAKTLAERIKEVADELESMKERGIEGTRAFKDLNKEMRSLSKQQAMIDAFGAIEDAINGAVDALVIGMAEMVGVFASGKLKEQQEALNDEIREQKKLLSDPEATEEAKKQAQERIATLKQEIEAMKPMAQVKNFVLSALADLAIQVGKIAVATGIAVTGIAAALETLFGPLAVIPGLALIALGSFVKSKLSDTVPAFADGVQNFGGGMALVGERGPELVNLPTGSDVIPNHMLGGGSNVIIPDLRIKGSDLLIVFDRATRQKSKII